MPLTLIEQLEEELDFQEILIESLDTGADDYEESLAKIRDTQRDLEHRLEAAYAQRPSVAGPSEQVVNNMQNFQGYNGDETWWQNAAGPSGLSYSQYGVQSSSMQQPQALKRPFPDSLRADDFRASKRQTPDPSNAGSPASSSTESFELVEHPNFSTASRMEQARARQVAIESAVKRQQQAHTVNMQRVRELQHGYERPVPSSSRPNFQTTIAPNGFLHRPPPHVKTETPQIQREMPVQTQIPQRSRPFEVIDLTNSDEDDEDVSEIARTNFTPSHRPQQHGGPSMAHAPQYGMPNNLQTGSFNSMQSPGLMTAAQYQMPGAFPAPGGYNGGQLVYGKPNSATPMVPSSSWTPAQVLSSAYSNLRNAASSMGPLLQLSNLLNVAAPTYDLDNSDDDVQYQGVRAMQPGAAHPAGYADRTLYQQRYDEILNYDPAKTTEEINKLLENIRPDEEMPAHLRVQTPAAMTIKLHKYQELGLTWLQKCEEGSNRGGILADDMGLGKTIQMLSLMVTRKSEDPRCKTTLIVAPVALMRQWRQEIEQKIKPGPVHSLTVFVHHGQSKKKSFSELRHYDVVLTTYGSLGAELKKLEAFALRKHQFPETRPNASERCVLLSDEAQWYRVILDEAQCIKNVKTATSKAACRLKSTYRFCMTGTPMMNGVDEFYALVKFLRIRPYHDWTKFRLDVSTPLKKGGEHGRDKAMHMLQALCKAVMLRRTKKSTYEGEPILILPERETLVDNPEFSDAEQEFYTALESQTQLKFNRYLKTGTVGSSYSAILVLLLRLRQACCHPHLLKDFGVAAAAGISPDQLTDLAKKLDPKVVERIKNTGGSFECPVCYDAVVNPAIFIPCGHDTCRECFAKIADPANAIRNGQENGGNAKCPTCREVVDPKQITDFESFKRIHMPELLTEDEKKELKDLAAELAADDSDSETADDSSEDEEDEDDADQHGNLLGFVVPDDVDVDDAASGKGEASTSAAKKKEGKGKKKKGKSKGKGKGKKREKLPKGDKAVTLSELKRLAARNAKARKAYMRRLREDWMTSAKIEKTMELLKQIMNETDEKVLIFSQWTSLLDLLEVPIDGEEFGYRRYDGSMNPQMRGDAVDEFRDERSKVRIMLVSLKAGNAGLNLNTASQVIILDPFWNPYIEEQAIDRAHRLGQKREVKVRHDSVCVSCF